MYVACSSPVVHCIRCAAGSQILLEMPIRFGSSGHVISSTLEQPSHSTTIPYKARHSKRGMLPRVRSAFGHCCQREQRNEQRRMKMQQRSRQRRDEHDKVQNMMRQAEPIPPQTRYHTHKHIHTVQPKGAPEHERGICVQDVHSRRN